MKFGTVLWKITQSRGLPGIDLVLKIDMENNKYVNIFA